MEHYVFVLTPVCNGITKSILHKFGVYVLADGVANNFLIAEIENDGQINPTKVRSNVSNVTTPILIQSERGKVTLYDIRCKHAITLAKLVGLKFFADHSIEPIFTHDTAKLVFVDINLTIIKLEKQFATPVHSVVLFEHFTNRPNKFFFSASFLISFHLLP